jgi:hypothetical protein
MGFEDLHNAAAVPEAPKKESEKVIPPNPHLRYIYKTLNLLHSEELPSRERVDRRELPEKVKSWENGMELSDNIREVVRDYVAKKIPGLKEKMPSIDDLPDRKLLDALANNWFEEIGDEISGQRREILLALSAHMVNHIENKVYEKVLEKSSEQELAKLNLTPELRDLTIKLLQVSEKADPLFIRFLAASQLTPEPPRGAKPLAMKMPGDKNKYTPTSLFPHETQFISRGFSEITAQETDWQKYPGGDIFKEYIGTLAELYKETDPFKIEECQERVEKLYEDAVRSGFPIIVTSAMEGYYKPPYLDPELKVSIVTPEALGEEVKFRRAREATAESLGVLGVSRFRPILENRFIRNAVGIGSFGSNLTFSVAAQEEPVILTYLNEQNRGYDQPFISWANLISNSELAFAGLEEKDKIELMTEISRLNTVEHELDHSIYTEKSQAVKRFGENNKNYFMETSAEILYRGMLPEIIERNGVPGTKEQWAVSTLTFSLQQMIDEEDSEYRQASIYCLDRLFESGTVELAGDRIVINNYDEYYRIHKELAEEILAQYKDSQMNEKKAKAWLLKNCVLGEKLKEADNFLKELVELRKSPNSKEALLVRMSNLSETEKKEEVTLDRIDRIEKLSFPKHMQTDREGLEELLSVENNIHFIAKDVKTQEDLAYLSAIPAEEEAESFLEWDPAFKPIEGEYYLESVSVIPTRRGQRVFSNVCWEKFIEEARERKVPQISFHARKGLSKILRERFHLKPLRTIENWQGWGEPFDFYEIQLGKRKRDE